MFNAALAGLKSSVSYAVRDSQKDRCLVRIFFLDTLREKSNGDDNRNHIPTTQKDNPTMGHNTTMGNNNRNMDDNSIPPKGRFVCSKERDIDNPSHQEV